MTFVCYTRASAPLSDLDFHLHPSAFEVHQLETKPC